MGSKRSSKPGTSRASRRETYHSTQLITLGFTVSCSRLCSVPSTTHCWSCLGLGPGAWSSSGAFHRPILLAKTVPDVLSDLVRRPGSSS